MNVESRADVLAHRFEGFVGTLSHRSEQRTVSQVNGFVCLSMSEEVREEVEPFRPLPHGIEEIHERKISCRFNYRAMDLQMRTVNRHRRRLIRRLDRIKCCFDVIERRLTQFGYPPRRITFDGLAGLIALEGVVARVCSDDIPATASGLDDPFAFQPQQSVTNRCSADIELRGKPIHHQPHAWLDVTRQHGLRDAFIGNVCERASITTNRLQRHDSPFFVRISKIVCDTHISTMDRDSR